jgi:hypothetical protein
VASEYLTLTGNYTQTAAATLAAGIREGLFGLPFSDQLFVSGMASLAGTLEISLDGVTPTQLDEFIILRAGALTGAFANVANGQRLDVVGGTESFRVNYGPGSPFNPNHVVLTNFLASATNLEGDFNEDGRVDAADYVVWRKNPGGLYTQTDYNTWRANFGQTAGGGAGASAKAAVPEPGVIALLIIGAPAIYARRRATASQLLVRGTRSSNDRACPRTADWRVC